MLSYIISVLGSLLQFFLPTRPHAADPPPAPLPEYKRTGLDLAVRLRVSREDIERKEFIRIFGLPPQADFSDAMPHAMPHSAIREPYVLFLYGIIPAYVRYVMGEDWKSKLRDDYETDPVHLFHNGEVIIRPSVTSLDGNFETPKAGEELAGEDLAEERAHCLRMRRCGGVVAYTELDIDWFDPQYNIPEFLTGWPTSGGLWVLQNPVWYGGRPPPSSLMTWEDRVARERDDVAERENYFSTFEDMKSERSMEGICNLLEKAGAHFYSRVEDCPVAAALSWVD